MFDPKVLSEYALSNMDASAESIQNSLNLFQIFKRLYEQNPALLNEILNMATVDKQMPVHPGNFSYVLGLVTDKQALLITNVSENRSQIFLQPQLQNQIWTFGRDPNQSSLPIRDRRLSRCHAAIRYDSACGFVLYDLGSTNGTYVNGMRIRQNYVLKDGDLVRLGSMNFGFFTGAEFRRVGAPSPEILRRLSEAAVPPTAPMDDMPETVDDGSNNMPTNLEQTLHFMSGTELVQD
ncbi:MAG: FHA domain-containing protein [Cyanobacteria bacterium P01_C01_bin.120]